MKAMIHHGFGGPEVLSWEDSNLPELGPTELLVDVRAAGVNRADILQRRGLYPPPPGESEVLGLEIAGVVVEVGAKVHGFAVGDRVCGLVAGGGYAERCRLEAGLAFAMPDTWSFARAAAVPEVFMTANENLIELGGLQPGETALIHAGGSGVGSTAIQMAVHMGVETYTTTGSPEKVARCEALGVAMAIPYKTQSFAEEIAAKCKGVDVVLDFVGARYLADNLGLLRRRGRLIVVGLLGGRKAELDLGLLLRRQLTIKGSVMRSLPLADKIAIKKRFEDRWWDLLVAGKLGPLVHAEIPMEEAARAHRMMEESAHFGKIVLVR